MCRPRPALSVFGRYGWRNLTTFDQPNIPLPSGGAGNGDIYAHNKQFVLGATWIGGSSLLEARFGYSRTRAGKNPPGLGIAQRARSVRPAGSPDRQPHRRRPPDAGHRRLLRSRAAGYEPAVAVSDRLQSEDQLHLDAPPHSFKSGYEFQRINTEVQDVNPLYGRDTYNGSFSRPPRAAASNLYNLADFMLGLRAQYALSSVLVADLRRNMHFAYFQDDWRAASADAQPRAPLRVLHAALGGEQRPVQLRSRDQHDGPGEGRIDVRSRADRSRSQQLRPAARASPTRSRRAP